MDTHRLRYFLRVAEEGSISRAAGLLGVAQPALSRQVRLLEQELGVTLFRRTARGVDLTEEGQQLRATTSGPLRQLELAMRYAGSPLARLERGLHLGMLPTTARILGVPLLQSLGAAFPRVNVSCTVAGTETLVEMLLRSDVDVAVMNPVADDRLFQSQLLTEELVAVGGPQTQLRADKPLTFRELTTRPLVAPATGVGIRNTLENTALRLKLQLSVKFATDSLEVAKGLVAAGHGYTVLPVSACALEIEGGRLRSAPLREPALEQTLALCVTSQLKLPRGLAAKVGEMIREEAGQLVASGAWAAKLCDSERQLPTGD